MSDTSLGGILEAGGTMNFRASLGNPRGIWSCGPGKGTGVARHSPDYVELQKMSTDGSEAAPLNFLQLQRDKMSFGGCPVSHGPEGHGSG